MDLFAQQLVDGVTWGAVYGALALSIVLVHRASGVVNFAQGEMAMFSAFLAWQFIAWGMPLTVAIAVSMVVSFVIGSTVELTLIRPHEASPPLTKALITLGLFIIFNNAAAWIWGPSARQFPAVFDGPAFTFGSVSVSRQSVTIAVVVMSIATVLYWMFQHTKIGLAMKATVSNRESAQLLGISARWVVTFTWGLAAAVGALIGCLVAPQLFLQPSMLTPTLVYAFAAAILGGIDSPVGAIVGGIIVGVVENLVSTYVGWIGNDFKQAVAFIIIIGVLLRRSEGLFGTKKVVRV